MAGLHVEGFAGITDNRITCIEKLDDPDEVRFDFVDEMDDQAPPRFAMVHIDTPADGFGPRFRAEGPYDERTYLELSGKEIRLVGIDDLERIDTNLTGVEVRLGITHPFSMDEVAGRMASLILARPQSIS